MIVLSNGYKLPETGDFGDVWFPSLEDNITRVNSHNHDGTNSEKLTSANISAVYQTELSASFIDQGGGVFRATVNTPAGVLFDDTMVMVKDPTTKDTVYLKIEKVNASQFYLFTNKQQDFEVYFLT